MKMFVPNSCIILFLFLLSSCGNGQHDISFYHWKSTLELSDFERDYLQKVNAQKIYLRLFDVKWVEEDQASLPFAHLKWQAAQLPNLEIIPVTYITNEVLKKEKNLDKLALEIANKFNRQIQEFGENYLVKEIQIDCDWTLSTKKRYFKLLEEIRKNLEPQKEISATIRLHQIKYFEKTGVPPVDRGVLMFYNMGKLTDEQERNSILDLETAKKYLHNFDRYPLHLDVALPLFSWGVQFRAGKVVRLINGVRAADLSANEKFEEIAKNRFRVKESHFLQGSYIYTDDEIRTEEVSLAQLKESVRLLGKELGGKDYDYIFYHLNESTLRHYAVEDLLSL